METNDNSVLNTMIDTLSKMGPLLLGGGGLFGFIRWRKENRNFDIKMNEIKKQNRQLRNSLISYVPRKSLDNAMEEFLKSNYIVCAILGPAGSGKTRFAQNITKRNSFFSKYHYIYINEKSGTFFSSEDFKKNYIVNGNRKYVFIFDYVFENVIAINNLLEKVQGGKHKFIFLERDYGWTAQRLLDRPEYEIVMEQHNMDQEKLSEVFCNQVRILNKKLVRGALKETANQYAEAIIHRIDPIYSRPIFAQLIAEIFVRDTNFNLNNIDNVSEIVEQYWHYKFDEKKIFSIIRNNLENVDSYFIERLEILLRLILLTASITKERILITKKDTIFFKIDNSKTVDNNKFNEIIVESCEEIFIDKLNLLGEKAVRQLFGTILKDYMKLGNRGSISTFEVVAELDLITEWVLCDSLKSDSMWIKQITSFLSISYKENYNAFITRGTIDFIDLVQLFATETGQNEFVGLLTQRINEAYLSNQQFEKIIIRDIVAKAKELFDEENYKIIIFSALTEIKKCYINSGNRELTEHLCEIMECDK